MYRKKILFLVLIVVFLIGVWGCESEQTTVEKYEVLTSVDGEGEVIKTPVEVEFSTGSEVDLIASPADGWGFSHWRRDGEIIAENLNESLNLVVTNDVNVTAVFKPLDQLLMLNIEGEGKINRKVAIDNLSSVSDDSLPVEIEAVPGENWIFVGWLGVEESKKENNPIILDQHEGLEVKAIFVNSDYSLSLEINGEGQVKVEEVQVSQKIKDEYSELADISREITSSGETEILLLEGSIIQITAIAEEDWKFNNWTGDITGSENPNQIEITGNVNLGAVFEEFPYYNLTADVNGEGEVEINIINVPFESNASYPIYPEGTELEIKAVPEAGWNFVEWTGSIANINETQNPVQIILNEDMELTAVVEQTQYSVEINTQGSGVVEEKVIELPEGYKSETTLYPPGSIVEFSAIADEGWEFSHWEGDVTEVNKNNNPLELEIQSAISLTAVFVEKEQEVVYYSLSLNTEGEGQINSSLVSGNIENGEYSSGSEVGLEAVPAQGWEFKNWSGDISSDISTQNPIQITMDNNYAVTAVFSEIVTEGEVSINGNLTINHNWPFSKTYEMPASTGTLETIEVKESFETKSGEYKEGEIIVGFSRVVVSSQQQEVLNRLGLDIKAQQPMLNSYLVQIKEGNVQEAIERMLSESGVRYAEPNYIYSVFSTNPNDDLLNYQWHYPQIRLPQVWDDVTGSSSVRIAVLDTGIDSQHPDLQNNLNLEDGYNFPDQSTETNDQFGHGTHVAGTIAADTNNSQGVAGVMWEAEIIPVKVLGDDGYGSNWDIAQGILYAAGLTDSPKISQPVDVINMSLGGSTDSESIREAVVEASNAGVIIVAAAGNSNTTTPMYPASYPEVISVGSVELNYTGSPIRAPYSCYGETLDVMAPGGNTRADTDGDEYADGVLSTTFEGSGDTKNYTYIYYQGTSMASPHVAGLSGLMIANGIPKTQIREILRESSFDLGDEGFDIEFGYGLVNAYWAVNEVQSIRLIIGTRDTDTINIVNEISVGLREGSYLIDNIPAGNHAVYAWIDVTGNNQIDAGDYLGESEVQTFESGSYQIDLILEEVE